MIKAAKIFLFSGNFPFSYLPARWELMCWDVFTFPIWRAGRQPSSACPLEELEPSSWQVGGVAELRPPLPLSPHAVVKVCSPQAQESLQEANLNPFQLDLFASPGSVGHPASPANHFVISQDSERAGGVCCPLEISEYPGKDREESGDIWSPRVTLTPQPHPQHPSPIQESQTN